MAKFKCKCSDDVHEIGNLRMKIVGSEVIYVGANCPKCDKQMSLHEKKVGVANFGSDKMGRVR